MQGALQFHTSIERMKYTLSIFIISAAMVSAGPVPAQQQDGGSNTGVSECRRFTITIKAPDQPKPLMPKPIIMIDPTDPPPPIRPIPERKPDTGVDEISPTIIMIDPTPAPDWKPPDHQYNKS